MGKDKEQIMIDGVDVSGCEYTCNTASGKNGCKHPMMKNIYCFKNPNCYYKQLQKEKFENLNNKQMVESAENLINENSELYKSLKEIEEYCDMQISLTGDLPFRTTESDILDIINKVKGDLNEE